MNMLKTIFAIIVALSLLGTAQTALADTFTCTPTEVMVYPKRIHVRCSKPAISMSSGTSRIWYFAVSTINADYANRFLSTGTTALVSGRKLSINFTGSNTSGTSIGCAYLNCRVPNYFGIK